MEMTSETVREMEMGESVRRKECSRSVTFRFGTDPDPAFFVNDLQANKNNFFSKFFFLIKFEGTHLHHSSKIKS
jgi:hypothetical protein